MLRSEATVYRVSPVVQVVEGEVERTAGEGQKPRGLAQFCCSLLSDFSPSPALISSSVTVHRLAALNLLGTLDFLDSSEIVPKENV